MKFKKITVALSMGAVLFLGNARAEDDFARLQTAIKDQAVESTIKGTANLLKMTADFYDSLAKNAYSAFGSANGIASDAERKAIQSELSKLSKKYLDASKKIEGVAGGLESLPTILTGIQLFIGETETRFEIQSIEKNLGITIDRSLVDTLVTATVDIVANSSPMTIGLSQLLTPNQQSFEVGDVAPSGEDRLLAWAKTMDGDTEQYKNFNQKNKDGKPIPPPAGVLQFLKMRYDAEKEAYAKIGVTNYENRDLKWVDSWSLKIDYQSNRVYSEVSYAGSNGELIYTGNPPSYLLPQVSSYDQFIIDANKNGTLVNEGSTIAPPKNDLSKIINDDVAKKLIDEAITTPKTPHNEYTGRAGGLFNNGGAMDFNVMTRDRGGSPITFGESNPLVAESEQLSSATMTATVRGRTSANHGWKYEYIDWGEWSGQVVSNGQTMTGGTWVVGMNSYPITLPRSGSATYNGDVMGKYAQYPSNASPVYGNLNGSVALTANFANQTINGNMNLLKDNGSLFARTLFNASITTGKNEFVGTQQAVPGDSATINGGVRGNFYGPANLPSGATPPEVGGTFWVSGSNGTGAGVFRAKKQ